MKFEFKQCLKAGIILGFAGFIFKLHYTDTLGKYINMKYVAFSQIALILLLFLFIIQMQRIWISKDIYQQHDHHCGYDGCGHDHGFSTGWTWKAIVSYIILVVPLLSGFLLPAKMLDAAIASKKGILLAPPNSGYETTAKNENGRNINQSLETADDDSDYIEGQTDKEETDDSTVYFDDLYAEKIKELKNQNQIQMTDKKFVSQYDTISLYLEEFRGKPIEMTGFVYKEDGMEPNQLVVSRFIITHCVADAGVLGFLAQLDEDSQLEKDTWIQVQGVLDIANYGDMELPLIRVTSWKIVNAPVDPYVYP